MVTSTSRRVIVNDGHPSVLDIRYRMLQNLELARAMGFCDEESEYEFAGNISEVTKQNGNAVPVRTAAAPVKAILDPTGQSGGGHDDTDNRGRSRVGAAP